ncbi:GntR family transcriptional regulator [Alicyclobacillus mali]|uniref:GntR family transcriptional regulator n=1 Tax=Alicyclobacillus mali (ex Roth et al. 2021) TaxID=1123961 RepID=A0ABS0F182_9BACL|nr:GntR family transcriptional regulator [Alicyclobacillus mali (ex Roth et al. 2021)]MBF8377068.1 GntR family transcriptional regulator [Alicyclobacillus mali (ex Roth et al. 2021)]
MTKHTPSKQQLAYHTLKQRILEGTYGPGYRIVIDRVAKELGVSAIPIREAIRRLEAEGLVEVERFSGAKVTRIDAKMYEDILSALAVLEGYATAQAYRNLTDEDFDALRQTNEAMRQARSDFDLTLYSRLNQQFHEIILRCCSNRYLVDEIHTFRERMDAMRVSVFNLIPHRASDSIAEHDKLIQLMAVDVGGDAVERFARQHRLATLEAFRRWNEQHARLVAERKEGYRASREIHRPGADS